MTLSPSREGHPPSQTTPADPSHATLTTLRSSQWGCLLQTKESQDEIVSWAKTQWSELEKKQLDESIDQEELIKIAAIFRILNHVHHSAFIDLNVENQKLKKTTDQMLSNNKNIRFTSKLNTLKETLLRQHFNMKVMYSVFRLTPFATSEVSHSQCIIRMFLFSKHDCSQ